MSPKLYFDLKEKLMDKHRLATVQGFPPKLTDPPLPQLLCMVPHEASGGHPWKEGRPTPFN